ncbi:hypothetical protein [Actinomadura kijaniata]|uniref:hypothetical protein n=1 Tax=Actinomadura kijaniata TaxID=46161 RepID=UPI003F533F97
MTQAQYDLRMWVDIVAQRDRIVHAAVAAGVSKHAVHTMTGTARTTIARILATPMEPVIWAVVRGPISAEVAVSAQDVGITVPPYVASWAARHGATPVDYIERCDAETLHLVLAPADSWDDQAAAVPGLPGQVAALLHAATPAQVHDLRQVRDADDETDPNHSRENAAAHRALSQEIAAETRAMWE